MVNQLEARGANDRDPSERTESNDECAATRKKSVGSHECRLPASAVTDAAMAACLVHHVAFDLGVRILRVPWLQGESR